MMKLSERGTVWQHRKKRFVHITEEVAQLEVENESLKGMIGKHIGAILPPSPMTKVELSVANALLTGEQTTPEDTPISDIPASP